MLAGMDECPLLFQDPSDISHQMIIQVQVSVNSELGVTPV